MIHTISADHKSFKTVSLDKGLNVVLAEQSDEADERDSRNGTGKSSLIEVIHFCLGSDFPNSGTLSKPELNDWTFHIEATIGGQRVTVKRSTSSPKVVEVIGNTISWPIQPIQDEETLAFTYTIEVWRDLLGKLFFNLPLGTSRPKFGPSFRQVVSYFIRLGRNAFSSPFEFRAQQAAYQTQVLNSFLLDLSWEHAIEWHNLKSREDDLQKIKKAAKTGYFTDVIGTVGELEAVKLRLEGKVKRESEQLNSFQVHPQYKDLELDANRLTEQLHQLSNDNLSDSRLVKFYEDSLKEEQSASHADVERVYRDAGIVFPERVSKRLEDVIQFHDSLTKNRESFLKEEIGKIKRAISGREDKKKTISDERAQVMEVLKTHKALEEFTRLQETANHTKAQLDEVKTRIGLHKKFETGRSSLKIEREELFLNTRRDYEERTDIRARAISLFNECSEALYNRPGQLIIDVTENGYSFDIEIEREQSDGVKLMEIFCYDLVVAQLWASKPVHPGFLIHDSSIFADVDERQIASALQLVDRVARENEFQYLCCLNSDNVPMDLFDPSFDFRSHVKLELKDSPADECLFGMRF